MWALFVIALILAISSTVSLQDRSRNRESRLTTPMPNDASISPRFSTNAEQACDFYTHIEGIFRTESTDRILSGETVQLEQFPHMARIIYADPKVVCGGSIISYLHILTAAHCCTSEYTLTGVIVGEALASNNRSIVHAIDTFISHPKYLTERPRHDIAIVKLKNRLKFSDYIFPACLYTKLEELPPSKFLVATGWGVTENGTTSNYLRKVDLITAPLSECRQAYRNLYEMYQIENYRGEISGGQLCAKGSSPGHDTCFGDGGGPLQIVHNGTNLPVDIVGIVSFGDRCGGSVPGVYTRVANYIPWIEGIVNFLS